jgi:DNA-binding XRE family transcriptional regulator
MKLNTYDFRMALAEADKSQADVARQLGKSQAWVTNLKKGYFTPTEKDAKAIVKFLGCKIEEIFVIDKAVKRGS